jgi:cytochrome c biogenesis protein CcmG/thiol:disulfide interchange protein DsbE
METSDADDARSPRAASTRRRVTTWIVALSITFVVVGFAIAELRSTSNGGLGTAAGPGQAVAVDTPAPDFDLPLLAEGEGTLSLSSLRGDVVVLNFWATWCIPCRDEMPGLQATWERYRQEGVRFVGVNALDDRASAVAFAKDLGITYPSVFDPSGTLSDDYRLVGFPSTFVIDRAGVIRVEFHGYVDEQSLTEAIEDVLAMSAPAGA